MKEFYYIKRDMIDDNTFHLYASANISNPTARYHISAIHIDFMRDLLIDCDSDFKDAILTMNEEMMAKVRINIEEVDFV